MLKYRRWANNPPPYLQMSPSSSENNLLSCGIRNRKLDCNLASAKFLGIVNMTHLFNNFLRELGGIMAAASWSVWKQCVSVFSASGLPAFLNHVRRVVLGCPKKKVGGIAARRVVALMANVKLSRLANKELVGKPVCRCLFPVVRGNSITPLVFASSPNPASVIATRLVEFAREFFYGLFWSSHNGSNKEVHRSESESRTSKRQSEQWTSNLWFTRFSTPIQSVTQ